MSPPPRSARPGPPCTAPSRRPRRTRPGGCRSPTRRGTRPCPRPTACRPDARAAPQPPATRQQWSCPSSPRPRRQSCRVSRPRLAPSRCVRAAVVATLASTRRLRTSRCTRSHRNHPWPGAWTMPAGHRGSVRGSSSRPGRHRRVPGRRRGATAGQQHCARGWRLCRPRRRRRASGRTPRGRTRWHSRRRRAMCPRRPSATVS
mmetsp:Transcript_29739/g.40036  ORF Transcript_29739/g.40036 Transcript_29739/m.40036 type:complete len:203 (+) Transcript_29739:277-885(+)